MKSLFEILQENKNKISARGGEKNYVISQIIPYLNASRQAQNARNYAIARKDSPMLTKEQYKRGKAYLRPLTHGRIGAMLKEKSLQETYALLAECKQAPNFSAYFWWKVKLWKQQSKQQ